MEQWEKEFNRKFTEKSAWNGRTPPRDVRKFIGNLLKEERKRDKLQEVLDFIKESRTQLQILTRYIYNNTSRCDSTPHPSGELMRELGPEQKDILKNIHKNN